MAKVWIAGSRSKYFTRKEKIKNYLEIFLTEQVGSDDLIGLGDADGIDEWSYDFLKQSHTVVVLNAEWKKHGRRAGFIRNFDGLRQFNDKAVIVWNGSSPGTLHVIEHSLKRGMKTVVLRIHDHTHTFPKTNKHEKKTLCNSCGLNLNDYNKALNKFKQIESQNDSNLWFNSVNLEKIKE